MRACMNPSERDGVGGRSFDVLEVFVRAWFRSALLVPMLAFPDSVEAQDVPLPKFPEPPAEETGPPPMRTPLADLVEIIEGRPGGKDRLRRAQASDRGVPGAKQQAARVPLTLWWSPSRQDNFTTSNPKWAGGKGATQPPDYRFVRMEGYVIPPDSPAPPGTVLLGSWWNARRGDNALTSNPEFRKRGPGGAQNRDYRRFRDEGYVRAHNPCAPAPADAARLYTWYSESRGDYFTTSQHQWAGKPGDVRQGYRFVRVEGLVDAP